MTSETLHQSLIPAEIVSQEQVNNSDYVFVHSVRTNNGTVNIAELAPEEIQYLSEEEGGRTWPVNHPNGDPKTISKLARDTLTGEFVVIKETVDGDPGNRFANELLVSQHLLQSDEHCRYVQTEQRLYISPDEEKYLLSTPYSDNTLKDWHQSVIEQYYKSGKQQSLNQAIIITRQLLEAIGYFQKRRVIHTDISPDNIYFKKEKIVKDGREKTIAHVLVADEEFGRILSNPFDLVLAHSSNDVYSPPEQKRTRDFSDSELVTMDEIFAQNLSNAEATLNFISVPPTNNYESNETINEADTETNHERRPFINRSSDTYASGVIIYTMLSGKNYDEESDFANGEDLQLAPYWSDTEGLNTHEISEILRQVLDHDMTERFDDANMIGPSLTSAMKDMIAVRNHRRELEAIQKEQMEQEIAHQQEITRIDSNSDVKTKRSVIDRIIARLNGTAKNA